LSGEVGGFVADGDRSLPEMKFAEMFVNVCGIDDNLFSTDDGAEAAAFPRPDKACPPNMGAAQPSEIAATIVATANKWRTDLALSMAVDRLYIVYHCRFSNKLSDTQWISRALAG